MSECKRYNEEYAEMDKLLGKKVKRRIRTQVGKKRINKKTVLSWAKTMIIQNQWNVSAYYWLQTAEHYTYIEVVDKKWVVLTEYLRSKSVEY